MFRYLSAALLLGLFASLPSSTLADSTDLSTPKKAAVEFAKGLEAGNMDAAKAASLGSDDDFKIVEIISGLVRAARDLRSTAMEKFGDAGKQILPGGDELAEFSKRVDSGTETIKGDTATVGQPDEREPMKLKKSADGSWRVDLAAIPEKEAIGKMMPKIEKVLKSGADDIKSGKYKTIDQAKDAISEQMFAVIAPPAASQPTEQPKK